VTASRRREGHRQRLLRHRCRLKDKGFDPGATDGVMGPKTSAALKAYQKSENLPTTGTMDGDTGAKLGVKVSTQGR
jgi:peptidoglycan hydrolase-like protein with peptidoglycan-binding domain